MKNRVTSVNRQSGIVLVVSLIMLLLLTLIGLTGMQTTSMEEKMAGNMRNHNLAFQSAESALRVGEARLSLATVPAFNNTNGLYTRTSAANIVDNVTEPSEWGGANSVTYNTGTLVDTVEAPEYIIQQMHSVESGGFSLDSTTFTTSEYFRVTALGKGGNTSAVVVVQSIYKR